MNQPLTFQGRLPGVVCATAVPLQQEQPLRLDVTGFVGLAERGPVNLPVVLHDLAQYEAVFGQDLPLARTCQGNQVVYANLYHAVQAFFDNGGQRCYVVRVVGTNAAANHFCIPSICAWDPQAQTLQSVIIPAAWAGHWSDALSVNTQLLSQPLPLSEPPIEWLAQGHVVLHLGPSGTVVQANDLLRLHFAGQGNPIVYCFIDTVTTDSTGLETIISTGLIDPQLASQETSPPATPTAETYGDLLQVDLLTFNLYIREEQTLAETWSNLRFSSVAPQSWLGALAPSEIDLREQIAHGASTQDIVPGLSMTRSALLGQPLPLPPAADGSVVTPLYLPVGMNDLLWQDTFVGPLTQSSDVIADSSSQSGTNKNTKLYGDDGLESFDPISLFLDQRLVGVGYRNLIDTANAILFASDDPQIDAFTGLHSLLLIDEIGIVSLPDLPLRSWSWDECDKTSPPGSQSSSGTESSSDKRCWSRFQACSTAPVKPPSQTPVKEVPSQLDLPIMEEPSKYTSAKRDTLITVQVALVNFCAARADVIGILSLPAHFQRRDVLDWQQHLTSTSGFQDGVPLSYVAVYHPWVLIPDDIMSSSTNTVRAIPPDGTICGMIAARELARGPWIAPANVPLLGVVGLSPNISDADWVDLYNAQVNLIRQLPGQFTLMSAHTLSLENTFLQISVRRLLIFLRKLALLRGMSYVFEVNNTRFRARVQAAFEATLRTMMSRGAITAFQIVTDSSINTQDDYDNGRFLIAIKIAPTQPIEFITIVLLRSGQDLLQVIEG